MKGQYLTLEYVLFFAIGTALVVGSYFMFLNINKIFQQSILESQLQNTGEMIMGTVINVFEGSKLTNSTLFYNLTIPSKLSGCTYSITVGNDLKLRCTNQNVTANITLYGFNIVAKNIIYSTKGLVEINASSGKVELK